MKKTNFLKVFMLLSIFTLVFNFNSFAQFGCGSGVVITNGYTQMGITTPGTAGIEDWNTNPTGTSINALYWDDDVYLFEYTAGATMETISMTIFTRNSWNGIGIFDDCTGTTFSTELNAASTTTANVSQTVTATIAPGNTVYIAVGQWGTPNDLNFDVTAFTVTQILCPDPTILTATNLTATSADLGWTENGTATTWDIEWGTAGFTPTGTPTIVGTTTNPHNLTGLTANTAYDFYVRADCGGTNGVSSWVGPFSFTTLCAVQLSGTFTIGATGTYPNFTAASAALVCGVNGPVVFNVLPGSGPYNEQITIPQITGTSATNTITFNGSGETITFATSTSPNNYIIRLDGADYITFDNLNVVSQSTTNNFAIHLINDADFNTINNCTIDLTSTFSSTGTTNGGIVVSGSLTSITAAGTSGANNTFTNNTIIGGYYGITINGFSSTVNSLNNTVTNNNVQDFYSYGLYFRSTSNSVISNNEISRMTRTPLSTFYGIYFITSGENNLIEANEIHDAFTGVGGVSTSAAYLIYHSSVDATLGNANKVVNNLIYNINTNGTTYGLYNIGSDGVHYYHNTISLDDQNTTAGITRGIYQTTTASDIEYKNNIISITKTGTGTKHCIYMNAATTTFVSNNNVFYINAPAGTNNLGYLTANQLTLANWQTASSQDANSVGVDPLYVNILSNNYAPTNAAIDGIADATVGVANDFFGTARAVTPDPGAIEFMPPSCFAPSALTATNITSTSADLGWTENGTATTWDIEWGTAGFTPTGTPTIVGTTTNPHNITGLVFNTTYEFYVRADCGGTNGVSSWAGPYSFFTGYCTPAPTSVDGQGITNVTVGSINNTTGAEVGNYGDYSNLVTNIAQGTTVTVNITYSTGYTYDTKIWIDWNDDLDFLDVGEEVYVGTSLANNPTTLVASFVVPLTAPLGNHRMRIGGQDVGPAQQCYTGSWGTFEDYTVNVTAAPTCLPPSALTSTNITTTSADLGWTENGTATTWDIEWGTAGFTPTGTPTVVGTTTNPHNIIGLTSNTSYEFYVRADCGGTNGVSTWSGPFSFSTSPDYCAGDHFYDNGGSTGNYADNSNDTTIICPSTPGGFVTVTFLSFDTETGYDDLTIFNGSGVLGTSFGTFDGTTIPGPFTSTDITGCLTFVFESDGSVAYSGWDAEITCSAPACSDPSNLTAFNIQPTSAMLDWTENGTATTWNIEWDVTGFTLGTGNPQVVLAKPYLLQGLMPNTSYDYYVQADCGNDSSAWVGPYTFATPPCMPIGLDLGVDTTVCSTDTLTLNAPTGGSYSYFWTTSWSIGDTTQSIVVDTASSGGNGTYTITVQVTDNNSGCFYTDTIYVTFSTCLGLDENASLLDFNIYPNPNKGQFTIKLNNKNTTELRISVTNVQGQEVFAKNNFDNVNVINEQINIGDVKGIYFVNIITNKEVITKKVIVQ